MVPKGSNEERIARRKAVKVKRSSWNRYQYFQCPKGYKWSGKILISRNLASLPV
jgi:hypothetical protein